MNFSDFPAPTSSRRGEPCCNDRAASRLSRRQAKTRAPMLSIPKPWRRLGSPKSPPRRLGAQARPTVECLEDRLVLSTFNVMNTNDSGAGSLRQAILDANANVGPDTIAFG